METKYYADINGNLLGGFSVGNPAIPAGAIETDTIPPHGKSIYDGTKWLEPVLNVEEKEEKLGVTDEAKVAAMWDFLANGNKTAIDDLKAKIDQANQ